MIEREREREILTLYRFILGWILPDIGPGSRITTIVKAANRIICFRKILYDS